MADSELRIRLGSVYELEWTTPDIPVVNKFVNPDGSSEDFPDPKPKQAGAPSVKITVERGPLDGSSLTQDRFFKNRTPPTVKTTTVTTEDGKTEAAKVFSARFKARAEGIYLFKIEAPQQKVVTRKMVVKVYRTIQQVLDDPKALRRLAVLANVHDFFPAFNFHEKEGHAPKGLKVDTDSLLFLDQGNWMHKYYFDGLSGQTSCIVVNPLVMGAKNVFLGRWEPKRKKALTANDTSKWAFHASTDHPQGPNPAWVPCNNPLNIPSVGDTYIVSNQYEAGLGHVGVIVHVPPDQNGMWVTADGGQANGVTQLALLLPRWGLMAKHLPAGGFGGYDQMQPEDEGGPFLCGPYGGDVHDTKGIQDGEVAKIRKQIKYRSSDNAKSVSNPRRMTGFVNIDDEDKIGFDVDKATPEEIATMREKAVKLQAKIAKVMKAHRDGRSIGGKGT